MLINQNHELSLKLQSKDTQIQQLNSMLSQGYEEKKDSPRLITPEDDSFESNFK